MKFVFWQNEISLHQSAYLRALAQRGHPCTWVVDCEVEEHRVAMGCGVPDVGGLQMVVAPDERTMLSILDDEAETVHVLSGLWSTRPAEFARHYCRKRRRRFGIISESANSHGWRGLLRRLRYRWAGLRQGDKPDFILAMGELGVRWYAGAGFPRALLFPFAYVTEAEARVVARPARDDQGFHLLCLASLIVRKAPDLLLQALARLPAQKWTLRFLGDGPIRAQLEAFVNRAGWEDRVEFLGWLPHGAAMRVLAESDLLVLPSRFDGWGAVVNEALMRGVPVLCSDRCGAADLLGEAWRGDVYPWRDVAVLAQTLERRISAGPPDEAQRSRIRAWARCLEGPAVADYFLAVMDHVYRGGPRPIAPWRRACDTSGS